jgi:hypothetical protein
MMSLLHALNARGRLVILTSGHRGRFARYAEEPWKEKPMERDAPNISTEHQPKGAGLNPSDTLDKPDTTEDKLGEPTDQSPHQPGTADVVDEKGRPITGDGLLADKED